MVFTPEVHKDGQPFLHVPNGEQPFTTTWTRHGMAGWWFCPRHGYVTRSKRSGCFVYRPLGDCRG